MSDHSSRHSNRSSDLEVIREGPESRYRWKSAYEYIYTSVIYSFSIGSYLKPSLPGDKQPNMLQYVLALFIIGMPLQYMQTILGQYSQRSVIFFRHATPLAHGLGYSCMLLSAVKLLGPMIAIGDYFLYFLNSFQAELPWTVCKKSYEDKCWNGTTCLTKCLIKEHSAAYCYWNYSYMGMIPEEPRFKRFSFRRPPIVLIFLGIIYYFVLNVKTVADRRIRYATYVALFGVVFLLVGLFAHNLIRTVGPTNYLYETNYTSLINLGSWYIVILDAILFMGLGFGGHVLLGSYMEPSTHSGVYALCSSIGCVIFSVITLMIPKTAIAILVSKANLTSDEVFYINAHDDEFFRFTYLMAVVRYLYIPQFWCIIYFTTCIIAMIAYIVLNIKVILLSVLDAHPSVASHEKTILFAYLLLCFIGSIGLTSEGLFLYTYVELQGSLRVTIVLLTFILASVTCFIYGVHRLCDDLHFINGEPPNKLVKMLWFFYPIPLCILSVNLYVNLAKRKHSWFGLTCICTYMTPLLVLAIVETFRYATIKHLAGVLQADEYWGPPSYYLKEKRKRFNPSKETRSTNDHYRCRHKCLMKSELLKKVLYAENEFHHLYPEDYLNKFQ